MDNNEEKFFSRRNFNNIPDDIEYYEDTHVDGVYMEGTSNNDFSASSTPKNNDNDMPSSASMPLPDTSQPIARRHYQNILVYEPRTPEDLEVLIGYLRRREPAIVNLDEKNKGNAQRCLDFISGAIYALNGTIQPIKQGGLSYLLSPDGVDVKSPSANSYPSNSNNNNNR